MDIAAFIISVFAFILSLVQFIRDTSREKKESTLNAYKSLQDSAFSKINRLLKDKDVNIIEVSDTEWEEITDCLVAIEQFSVGINKGIYSLDILNEIGGNYFIRIYDDLEPSIGKRKKLNISNGEHYNHFQHVAKKLKEMQK